MTHDENYAREGACSLCPGQYRDWGNNPWPLRQRFSSRCCHECNARRVIPARLGLFFADTGPAA
jgi:hypothetical protein